MTLPLTKKHNFDLVFDSQMIYRLILRAMSNPGEIVSLQKYAIKLYGDDPVLLAVALTLLDNEVSFHVFGNNSLSDEISSLTHAEPDEIEAADFIFVCDIDYLELAIENAKSGTLNDPHKSATVIIQNDTVPSLHTTFSGPGIDGQSQHILTQTVTDAIMLRDKLNFEYPLGIDFLFISSFGEMLAIPRLVKVVD